jgi:hypothetical protein
MTLPLSPTAQEIFSAFNRNFDWIEDGVPGPQFKALSAALLAVAEQIQPGRNPIDDTDAAAGVHAAHESIFHYLLSLADEFECM